MIGWIVVFSLLSLIAGVERLVAGSAPTSGLTASMFFAALSLLCIVASAARRNA